jgi:hypothetical protein
MPFLEAAPFITEAVESVLAQTYHGWELLLVDDGATDGSDEIAREYARRFPEKVRRLEHPGRRNAGASASRNLAIRNARGEYVAFLDADDVWLPRKLEEQLALLDAHPEAVALYGRTLYWHGWTGDPEDALRDHDPELGVPTDRLVEPPIVLTRSLRGEAVLPCPCSLVARREVVERLGGFEDRFRRVFTDQVFYTKLLLAGPVYVSGRCWDRYRQQPGSSVLRAKREGDFETARVAYLEWARGYLAERGLEGSEADLLMAAQLRRLRPSPRDRVRRGVRQGLAGAARRVRRAVRALRGDPRAGLPAPGRVRFGSLRRTEPVNRHWGWERGQPMDRFYVEEFLARHAGDVRGRVLEVGDDSYTRRFGGDRVTVRDVLHVHAGNPVATVVADLADADHVPSDTWDCIILTQTIHLVYDLRAAMRTLHRILRPGGVLLVTAPGISQTTDDSWRDSWYWALTVPSMRRLALGEFPEEGVEVESRGNVLTAVAFLHGLAREELRPEELAATDRDFPLVVTLRARKPSA